MKRGLISVLFAGLFIFWGQGCATLSGTGSSTAEVKKLADRIKGTTLKLGYSEQVADEFAEMVLSWPNGFNNCLLAELSGWLSDARQLQRAGRISKSEAARVEREVIERLIAEIRWRIGTGEEFYDLGDIVKNHKAQCLGFVQIFYVTGRSTGLEVMGINVLELDKKGPLPVRYSHVAAMVHTSDGATIIVNVVPNGLISRSFVLADTYERAGSHLKLKEGINSAGVYRRILLLDEVGLSAYVCSDRAVEYNDGKRYEEAIESAGRAIQIFPALAEAWNNRGIAYRNTGQIERAISDYTQAIRLNPSYQLAWNNRGVAYAQIKRYEEAIADYTRAAELNPGFAEAYNNRGNAYAKLGQSAKAIADYDRAIKHNPSLSQAYGNRAVNYAILGKDEKAKKDLAAATRINPELGDFAARISQWFQLGLNSDRAAASASAR